ncbi:NAD-dependent epimerase/dehydratase family protein [Nitrospira moscoviensis]|uniref:NAD-dependent epimerase/dehydratase n=1 Tax=Nitrospira moscoviensis TaxID=42253 RepID=A0A0K2GFS2_NITMO|nr:SDR family oxidoreductase [Nitrospira moscoviensis]ALA59801.1 NAD-dependent epimerase/dehydratase [Nitrospira moscoviensis]
MRVMITGHKGYIGTVMVPMVQAAGHEVVGLDSDLYRNSTYGKGMPEVDEIIKDIRDLEKEDLRGIDAIIHLAGLSNDVLGDLNPELTYDINHKASVRMAEMAKEVGIRRFVFASSCSNYGAAGNQMQTEEGELHPVTAYAISKVRVERDLAQLADDHFSPVIMRNATAYGVSPRIRFDIVLNNLTAWAFTTGHVLLKSDGTPWRPIVHIEDISTAAIGALESPREVVHNQVFNVGINSENYQMRQLADIVGKTVPNCEIKFAAGAEPDKRNYRVDFTKYTTAFPRHRLRWNATQGAKQIYESYKTIGLGKDEYEGPRYKRIAQLKLLLSTGQLDDTLRWRQS